MRRWTLPTIIVALAASSLFAPAASAVTIGPPEIEPTTGSGIQCSATAGVSCTFAQASPAVAAPFDGVVTRWRMRVLTGSGTVKLRILRGSGPLFDFVTSSASQLVDPGPHQFETHIPIRRGDRIGMDQQDVVVLVQNVATDQQLSKWQPPAADGTSAAPTVTIGGFQLVLSADVEPDVDGDGLGDDTQDSDDDGDGLADGADNCPTVAGTGQTDTDGDGQGDACDADDDNDGLPDTTEAAFGSNPLVVDSDGDGRSDGSDPCVTMAGPSGCPPPVMVEGPTVVVEAPRPPAAKLVLKAPAHLSRRAFAGGVKFTVTSDQPVALRLTLGVRGRKGTTILAEKSLPEAGGERSLKLKPSRRGSAGVKRAELRVLAINAAGKQSTARKTIAIR